MVRYLSADEEHNMLKHAQADATGFRTLYQHYFQRVYAYVAHRLGNKQDAEDVTSDIFLKIVKSIRQFEYRNEGCLNAWIFRIANNAVTQFHRQTRVNVALDDVPEIAIQDLTPEGELQQKELFIYMHRLINDLSPRRQEIIRLRFFGGLRNHEIAEALDLDERTIASHLSRGLDDLYERYHQRKEITSYE